MTTEDMSASAQKYSGSRPDRPDRPDRLYQQTTLTGPFDRRSGEVGTVQYSTRREMCPGLVRREVWIRLTYAGLGSVFEIPVLESCKLLVSVHCPINQVLQVTQESDRSPSCSLHARNSELISLAPSTRDLLLVARWPDGQSGG
jgi:hypothetical protein